MRATSLRRSLFSGLAVFLLLSAINFSLAGADSNSDRELLPYEPIQYIKTVSPSVSGDSVWREFVELSAQEAGQLTADMKAKLKTHLAKSGTSVVFAKGERVLTQRRSSKLKWDSAVELPFSNTLSLLSVVLPILLEGYKHSVIADPIGDVLKGKDLESPLVKGHESKSFLDFLNKLPKSGSSSLDLSSSALLSELNTNGKLAIYFANTVLGQSAKEAWLDALLAIGMEEMKFSKDGRLEMSLNALLQYALTVLHDFRIQGGVTKSETMSPDNDHFLFGWWQNCPKSKSQVSKCLLPGLPEDAIFSLSPSVRIYVSPSLELLMIILGPNASPMTASGQYSAKRELKSINDILQEDGAIWEQISSVISGDESDLDTNSDSENGGNDGFSQSDANKQEREKKDEQKVKESDTKQSRSEEASSGDQPPVEDPADQSELAKWIHWLWPMVVFVFWVTISHVWVYWMLYCGWFILTRISKRAHIPRPKTAADAGQN